MRRIALILLIFFSLCTHAIERDSMRYEGYKMKGTAQMREAFGKTFSRPIFLSYRASVTAGYTFRDKKVDVYSPGPTLGAKLALDIIPLHYHWNRTGLREWNDATCGVAIDYVNMGNNQWLGSLIAPYTYLTIPILRFDHFELGIRPGIGLAFATKTYRNTYAGANMYEYLYKSPTGDIIANQCIGSVTNFYFAEALYLAFPIRKGFAITASAGWYHASNGSTIQPNSGYNMLNAELGLSYTPDEAERAIKSRTYHMVQHPTWWEDHPWNDSTLLLGGERWYPKPVPYTGGWDFEASVSGGFRQVYYKDQQTFGVGAISLAAHYQPWSIFKIGGGVDVFFDGAYHMRETKFGKTYVNLATAADMWRLGISLQPEFTVGRFSAGFHFGAYLLDGVKNLEYSNDKEKATLASGQRLNKPVFYSYDLLKAGSAGNPDGWLYTRILLKYRPTDHFFVQLGMKAHLTKVEFIDAGVGFTLHSNRQP